MSVRLVSAPGRLLGNLLKLSKRSRLPLLERSVNGTAIPPTAIEILASLRRPPTLLHASWRNSSGEGSDCNSLGLKRILT